MAAELDLNFEFIRKAEKVVSFNLVERDFMSTKYKKEIRYLYIKNFFPNFDTTLFTKQVNIDKLNKAIDALKREDLNKFRDLVGFTPRGIGPGEVMLYLLIDDAYLGGSSSAGVDIMVGTQKFEVKAAEISKNKTAYNFKLGGTVPLADIIVKLNDLGDKFNFDVSRTTITGTTLDRMRAQIGAEYDKIENLYKEVAYNNYFKDHEVIFINNNNSSQFGRVEAIKQVQKADITIERVTSGTIKPRVKL